MCRSFSSVLPAKRPAERPELGAARLIQRLFPSGTGGAQKPFEWMIVGLGNPGPKYKNTRHNVGWWALDDLAEHGKGTFRHSSANADTAEIEYGGTRVLLVRPLTFVNRSGEALRTLLRKHHIDVGRLIVIYDDLNLEPGKLRIRIKGGAGGHNGMKSIIASLGTEEFARMRVGVGRPISSSEQTDHVLGTMAPRERELVRNTAKRAAEAAELAVSEGIDKAMNRYNG